MEKLRACPFCGGTVQMSRVPGGALSILCSRCGAMAMLQGTGAAERAALAAAWNRRTSRPNFQRVDAVKPCPFCASRQELAKRPDNSSIIVCQSCRMMVSFVNSSDLPTSVVLWNRRVE